MQNSTHNLNEELIKSIIFDLRAISAFLPETLERQDKYNLAALNLLKNENHKECFEQLNKLALEQFTVSGANTYHETDFNGAELHLIRVFLGKDKEVSFNLSYKSTSCPIDGNTCEEQSFNLTHCTIDNLKPLLLAMIEDGTTDDWAHKIIKNHHSSEGDFLHNRPSPESRPKADNPQVISAILNSLNN